MSPDGLASVQTLLQTTATATIKRRNSASPWSPPPSIQRPNPLFQVIASHWGPENAHAVMQRVIRSRSVPSKTNPAPPRPIRPPVLDFLSFLATSKEEGDRDAIPSQKHRRPLQPTRKDSPETPSTLAHPAPAVPKRQASLKQCVTSPSQHHPEDGDHDGTLPGTTVRRKGYRKIRRAASFFQASSSPSGPSSSPPPSTPTLNCFGADVEVSTSLAAVRAETERQRGLRARWSVGAEAAPAALTPVVVGVKMDGEGLVRELDAEVPGECGSGSVKARKGKGKERGWWAGWWQ